MVRDVSRQLGKDVGLVASGETAEADKTIVDRLFEPLVHLVRNAVDHGIESPTQRRTAGKPETATISIEASCRRSRPSAWASSTPIAWFVRRSDDQRAARTAERS